MYYYIVYDKTIPNNNTDRPRGGNTMYTATLFRQTFSQKEYRTIRVREIADISNYTGNGWRCISYSKSMF